MKESQQTYFNQIVVLYKLKGRNNLLFQLFSKVKKITPLEKLIVYESTKNAYFFFMKIGRFAQNIVLGRRNYVRELYIYCVLLADNYKRLCV